MSLYNGIYTYHLTTKNDNLGPCCVCYSNELHDDSYWVILMCNNYNCTHLVHTSCLINSNYATLHISHAAAVKPYPKIIPLNPIFSNPIMKIQLTITISSAISSNKLCEFHFYAPIYAKENNRLYSVLSNEDIKLRHNNTFQFQQINFSTQLVSQTGINYHRWSWIIQFIPNATTLCYLLLDYETGNRITLHISASSSGFQMTGFQIEYSPLETWLYYPPADINYNQVVRTPTYSEVSYQYPSRSPGDSILDNMSMNPTPTPPGSQISTPPIPVIEEIKVKKSGIIKIYLQQNQKIFQIIYQNQDVLNMDLKNYKIL